MIISGDSKKVTKIQTFWDIMHFNWQIVTVYQLKYIMSQKI
jgi:hypothetical protein